MNVFSRKEIILGQVFWQLSTQIHKEHYKAQLVRVTD